MNELDDSTTTTVLRSEGRSQGHAGLTRRLKVEDDSFHKYSLIIISGSGIFLAQSARLLQSTEILRGRRLSCGADIAPR